MPQPFSEVVGLQRTVGNAAVARLLQREVAEAPAATKRKLVCWGAKGPDVSYLQVRLNRAPDVTTLLEVDGKFGPKTYAAVKQFQRAHKPLEADGIVGEETWAAVEAIPDEPQDREAMSIKYYEAGAAQYKKEQYGHAFDLFTQASEYAESPELLFNRAQALRSLGGRRKEAMALYEQFIGQVSDADSAAAKRLLAKLRGPTKTGDAAVDEKATDELFKRAAEAHKQGRYGEAADLMEAASEVVDAPEFVYNRAQALRLLGGRRKEAMALYEQFIGQVSDADAELAKRLLAKLRGPKKTGDAAADAKAVDELFKQAEEAHKKGRYGQAADLMEAASEVVDAPEFVYNRAQALRLLGGRREEAIALYERFIAMVREKDSALAKRFLAQLKVPGGRP